MIIDNKQVKISALLSYCSIVLNVLSGLLFTPWMISQIGQSQYGIYTLANSLIALLFIDFGLGSVTSRYIAQYHVCEDEQAVNNFLGAVYKLYIILDALVLICLIVVYFLIDNLYATLTIVELSQFKLVYLIAALAGLLNFPFSTLNGILTAYGMFFHNKIADVIHRLFIVIFMSYALLKGYGLYALVTVNAISGLVVIFYKLVIIRIYTKIKVNFKYFNKQLFKEIFALSFWSTVAALAQRLIFNITPTILGIVSNSINIAIFGIVTTLESYVYIICNAINGVFLPKISKIYSELNSNEKILKLLIDVGKYQFAVNGLIITGFLLIGKQFISLWLGGSYLDAYYGLLLVIVPGAFFNSLQVANTAMVVTKKVDILAKTNLFMGIINVIMSFYLSKKYGVLGASLSICLAYFIRVICLIMMYKNRMNINMIEFVKMCYVPMTIIVIISILVGGMLISFISIMGWKGLIIKGIIIVVVYFTNLFLFNSTSLFDKIKL